MYCSTYFIIIIAAVMGTGPPSVYGDNNNYHQDVQGHHHHADITDSNLKVPPSLGRRPTDFGIYSSASLLLLPLLYLL